jgi:hypothetical protein
VGGIHTSRTPGIAGQPTAYAPVSARQQREALSLLVQNFFNADSFRFQPEFLAGAAVDYEEGDRSGPLSVPSAVLQLQTAALERLLSPGTAVRLLEAKLYAPVSERAQMISLHEVYLTLQDSIWSELSSARDIDSLRRNLQREHLRRLQVLLTRGASSGGMPPDALSLLRMQSTDLQAQLKAAMGRPGLSIEAKAHLLDSYSQLTEALRASMQRGS